MTAIWSIYTKFKCIVKQTTLLTIINTLFFISISIYRYNTHAMQKLRREVERAKRTLSYQHETRIEIEAVENREVSYTLTRAMFEKLNMVVSYMYELRISHFDFSAMCYIVVYFNRICFNQLYTL